MKIAGFYARVSSDKQREEKTIESQTAEIKEKIKADGCILPDENIFIDDGWSGAVLERPALDQMRDAAVRKQFDALYVYDRGRLARKFVYQELVIEELQKLDIEFVTLHDIAVKTAEDTVLQGMQGLFHEYERIKIAERMRRGKLYKARSGHIVNGPAPYGYRYVPRTAEKQSHYVIDEEEAGVIRKIFTWVSEEGLTVYGVVKRLAEEDIWPRKKKRKQWSKSVVARILRSEVYIGTAFYNRRKAIEPKNCQKQVKYKKYKKTSRVKRPKEKWIPIAVSRIIDDELFFRAREQLQKNYRFAKRSKKRDYLLGSLTFCECGAPMVGEYANGHKYYRCTDRLKHQPLPRKCMAGGVNCKRIDGVVWSQIEQLLKDPVTLREQATSWLEGNQSGSSKNKKARLEQIEDRLQQLESQEKKHAESYAQELITFSVFKGLIDQIKLKRASLISEKKKVYNSLNQPSVYSDLTVDEVCVKAPKAIESLLEKEKRAILEEVIDKIVIDKQRKEAQIFGYLPLYSQENTQDLVNDVKSRYYRITKRW